MAERNTRTCYQGETFENFDPGKALNDTEYNDCLFKNCRWLSTRVKNCRFLGCSFEHCNFSGVVFNYCEMRDAWLENSAFRSISWGGLQGRNAISQVFGRVHGCVFQYNEFSGMVLAGFDFSDAAFTECIFDDCRLAGANFRAVPLRRTSFSRCDLQKADFREADAYAIDLCSNKLKGARFSFPDVVALLGGTGIIIE